MRFFVCCVLLALVAIAAAIPANLEEVPQTLYDVDVQGHENVGDREARQFGYGGFGGYRGGYGAFGGYRGGYGGFGGYRGGYGGYGGYRVGYGGYRGGFYG